MGNPGPEGVPGISVRNIILFGLTDLYKISLTQSVVPLE